jgi:transcriptional regulator with XRE-family HTH domain
MRARGTTILGALLGSLRKRRRVSQETLARQSGVSRAIISIIERGFDPSTKSAPHPRPDTLRQIATGLAQDGDGQEEPGLAAVFYGDLMQAAGYGVPAQETAPPVDPEAILAELARDPEVGSLIAKAARMYPDMTPEQRVFFTEALKRL